MRSWCQYKKFFIKTSGKIVETVVIGNIYKIKVKHHETITGLKSPLKNSTTTVQANVTFTLPTSKKHLTNG